MNTTAFWRLVWKEYRMQRAFWLAMVGLTLIVQAVFAFSSELARGSEGFVGPLFAFAFLFSAFYAWGCGATLFATERETGTYEFQRTVPISWRRLLAAKMTWAALSTLAIFAVLIVLAVCVSGRQLPDAASARDISGLLGFGAIELLLWGVLFSLLVDQPLVAAILAITTVSLYVHLLAFNLGTWHELSGYLKALPLRIPIAAIVGAFDVWLARRWFRDGGGVVSISARGRRAKEPAASDAPGPEPERPSRWALFGNLLWQQWRQSRRMMLVLAATAAVFVYVGLWTVGCGGGQDEEKVSFLLELAALTAAFCGCCVFLGDQRREQLGFLADRGAWPGFVWLTRQLVWLPAWLVVLGVGLLAFLLFPVNDFHYWLARWDLHRIAAASELGIGVVSRPRLIDLAVCVSVAYAGGQFCSMLFRGGILTLVFGGMLAFGLCLWTQLMRSLDLSPLWSAAPLAVAMLAATWLRTPNWILQRNTVRAWLPVATVVVVPAIAILVAVPLVRVHCLPDAIVLRSIPRFMQVQPVGIELRSELTPEERATAEMYHRAMDLVRPTKSLVPSLELVKLEVATLEVDQAPKAPQPESPPVVTPPMVAFVEGNQEALALTLAATRRPLGDVSRPPKPEYMSRRNASCWTLEYLLVTSAQVAQSQGNLDDAMERYLAVLRLRRYFAYYSHASDGGLFEFLVYDYLPYWAARPGQTPQRLRAMLREIDALVRTFPPLDLTVKQQRARVLDLLSGDPQAIAAANVHESIVYKIALYSRWFPWEITRAVRILEQETYRDWQECGLLVGCAAHGEAIPVGRLEYYDTARDLRYRRGRPIGLESYLESYYPQERLRWDFAGRFRELEARRRVVRLTLALYAWRLEHGRLPDSLDALVGPDLPKLPVDPYSGQSFKYFPAGFAFPIVGSSEMHAQWKIFSSGTPMLASQPLSLVLGAANDVTMSDERWWAPQWPDWPAAKTSWFARRIYPLPLPQKSAAAANSDVQKGTSDDPEGRLTIAQRSKEIDAP